jgi:hypothetical protein
MAVSITGFSTFIFYVAYGIWPGTTLALTALTTICLTLRYLIYGFCAAWRVMHNAVLPISYMPPIMPDTTTTPGIQLNLVTIELRDHPNTVTP